MAPLGGEHCGEFGLHLQLLAGASEMVADGVRTQAELDGDLFGLQPQSQQAQHVQLAASKGTRSLSN